MIIKDEDAIKRLTSPLNLVNQLKSLSNNNNSNGNKRQNAMSLFCGNGNNGNGKREESRKEVMSSVESMQLLRTADINGQTNMSGTWQSDNGVEPHPSQNTQLIPLTIPQEPISELDKIIENHDAQVKLGLAHNAALDLLSSSVELLKTNLGNVRSDKLPSVISAASKVVESIRKERNEAAKGGNNKDVHFHFYTPQQRKVEEYEIVDVN